MSLLYYPSAPSEKHGRVIRPAHDSDDYTSAHEPVEQSLEEYLASVQDHVDRIMMYVVLGSFVMGLAFGFVYDTWRYAFGIGGMNVGLFLVARFLVRQRLIARMIVSTSLAFFMLQFIGQMHGMAEQHFSFFVYAAILILYQDWRVQVPYVVLAIAHHSVFFYFQLQGIEGLGVYFIDYAEVDYLLLTFHYGWAIMQSVVCGYWAVMLREQNLRLVSSNNTVLEKNEQVKKSKKRVDDSINYAQRIQNSLLPSKDRFLSALPESFVFYQPRDVVSGDFYYINKRKDKVVLAVGDCTGHGVPGAMLSILGMENLHKVVNYFGIESPDFILYELDRTMREALSQDNDGAIPDGMDVAVAVIDLFEDKLHYAGAKSPLYLAQGGKLQRVKGDKHPIGGRQRENEERVFTLHTFDISEPTTIFMASDGYQDQFGGKEGRKYMSKNFRKLLHTLHDMEPGEQARLLKDSFVSWKGDNQQTDDVLVVGTRL